MMNTRSMLSTVALLSLLPTSALAQAWTRDQGRFYTNLSYTRISATSHIGLDGEKRMFPEPSQYIQNTIGIYGEIGVVDRWLTATLSSELLRNNVLTGQGETTGFGDSKIGLWSGLITKPFRLSLGLTVGLPTGDAAPTDGGVGANDNSIVVAKSLPTGDGEFDFEPGVAFGHAFGGGDASAWPLSHFLVVQGGYQIRTKDEFRPAVAYKIELGSKFPKGIFNRFWLITRITGQEALSVSDDAAASLGGVGNVTHTTLGVELYGKMWKGLGASLTVDLGLRAKGIVSAIPLKAALSYEY